MSAAFIGCKISLISKSEIRYEGILYTIDTKESTIALAKVRSYGTEDRVTDKPVAPRNEVYEYIIFRASDIKDLIVDDPPAPPAPGLTDPAIIQAQSVGGSSAPAFSPTFSAAPGSNLQKQSVANVLGANERSRGSTPIRTKSPSIASHQDDHPRDVPVKVRDGNRVTRGARGGSGTMQNRHQSDSRHQPDSRPQQHDGGNRYPQRRYDGDNRQSGGYNQRPWGQRTDHGNRGPQGNRPQWYQNPNQGRPNAERRPPRPMPIAPTVQQLEDYDFEKAQAEFVELTNKVSDLKVGDAETGSKDKDENQDSVETYNKTKSFFDSISCEAIERSKGNRSRIDRNVERELNKETFGVSGVRRGRGWGNRGYNNRNNYYNRGDQRYDGHQNNQNRRGGYYRRDGQQSRPAARAGGEGWRNSERDGEK